MREATVEDIYGPSEVRVFERNMRIEFARLFSSGHAQPLCSVSVAALAQDPRLLGYMLGKLSNRDALDAWAAWIKMAAPERGRIVVP